VGAGENYGHKILPGDSDLLIAADGGYEYLKKIGVRCDVVIGDFDSLKMKPDHPNVVELKKEKDDTDMLAAINLGFLKGYRTFHIYGGVGSRFDHALANQQCLAFLAQKGARGFLYGEDFAVTCINNGCMDFDADKRGIVSVFAHSDTAKGVYLRGFKYELENAELTNCFPLGVSNEFVCEPARVSVEYGVLTIIFPFP